MSPHYTAREEPNGFTMQEQVSRLGWTCGPSSNPGDGRLAVYNRYGALKGEFNPQEWFEYIERRIDEHDNQQQREAGE